jgi:hypothetical protein
MDCIVPGHSVRPFCAAISCLTRVGKEVYFEFDPIDGLTLRALNDSKSAFCAFQFDPSYFLRCTLACFTGSHRPHDNSNSNSNSNNKRRKMKTTRTQDSSQQDDDRWCVRISIKALAAILRPRKNVASLQVVTTGDFLSFEFSMQRPNGMIVQVIHQVGVATANSVAAVANTTGSSELVVQPTVVMPMLEPLRRAAEIALLVNETHKHVSSATVAHDDFSKEATSSLATQAALKTETSIRYDELVSLDYASHPDVEEDDPQPPPGDLKEQVVLVFSLKEFKALLHYCAHAHVDIELDVTISFFWGGKPLVVKAKGEGFTTELVLATLDHKLLQGMKTAVAGADG